MNQPAAVPAGSATDAVTRSVTGAVTGAAAAGTPPAATRVREGASRRRTPARRRPGRTTFGNVRRLASGRFQVRFTDATLPDMRHGGGRREEVDPVRRLIAAAAAWGLNPDKDALYLSFTPADNDGSGVYQLTLKDVPVDGFWSVSVYDANGHFVHNAREAYTLNKVTATTEPDGSVAIQFGGCDDNVENCLPIFPGWNDMVPLYRPRATALDGT